MNFTEFIQKPFVVYEEEQPVAPQPEPEKPRILTPDKKLKIPAQPKSKKPLGMKDWHPEGRMVDAFPNAVKIQSVSDNYYQKRRYNQFASDSIFQEMESLVDRDTSWQASFSNPRFRERLNFLRDKKPKGFKWASNRDEDTPEFKEWRKYNDELHKMEQYMKSDYIGVQKDSLIGEYTRNMYSHINHYLRYGKIEYDGDRYRLPVGNNDWHANKEDAYAYYDAIASFLNEGIMTQQEYRDMPPRIYHRNIKRNPFRNLEAGDIIRDPGILSTTRNLEGIPWNFGYTGMDIFGGKNRYDIYDWQSRYPDEQETLFAPNTELKYIGQGEDGRYKFDQVGFNRDDYDTMTESKNQKPIINKFMEKLSQAFKDRMNDFHFELLKQEEPEQEPQQPEPKQFRDVLKKMVDMDD